MRLFTVDRVRQIVVFQWPLVTKRQQWRNPTFDTKNKVSRVIVPKQAPLDHFSSGLPHEQLGHTVGLEYWIGFGDTNFFVHLERQPNYFRSNWLSNNFLLVVEPRWPAKTGLTWMKLSDVDWKTLTKLGSTQQILLLLFVSVVVVESAMLFLLL